MYYFAAIEIASSEVRWHGRSDADDQAVPEGMIWLKVPKDALAIGAAGLAAVKAAVSDAVRADADAVQLGMTADNAARIAAKRDAALALIEGADGLLAIKAGSIVDWSVM